MKTNSFFIILSVLLISCAELASEAKSWVDHSESDALDGKYHFLEEDGTKIFLPTDFERYSIAEYQKVLDSVLEDKAYRFEVNRLNKLKEAKGEFYIYFDEFTGSTYTINTTEYMPISKNEASQLLGIIRLGIDRDTRDMPVEIEKITARYSGDKKNHIFKAVYRISDQNSENEWYSSTYIISSNLKSVYINLTTGFEVDFDPFISKTIL